MPARSPTLVLLLIIFPASLSLAAPPGWAGGPWGWRGRGAIGDQRWIRPDRQSMVDDFPDAGAMRLADVARYALHDGKITVNWDGPDIVMSRITVPGSTATFVLHRQAATSAFRLARYDWAAPAGQPSSIVLYINADRLYLTVVIATDDGPDIRASYTQFGDVTLRVTGAGEDPLRVSVPTLFALRDNKTEETRRYVDQPLSLLGLADLTRPGWVEIYRRFPNLKPDPKTLDRATALITQLDAPDPADRAAASRQLTQLGGPAIYALLHADPAQLSAEQSHRIAALLATEDRGALTARDDRHFLHDCLLLNDPTLSNAASTALASHKPATPTPLPAALTLHPTPQMPQSSPLAYNSVIGHSDSGLCT